MKKNKLTIIALCVAIFVGCFLFSCSSKPSRCLVTNQISITNSILEYVQFDLPRTYSMYTKEERLSINKRTESQNFPSYIADINEFVILNYQKNYTKIYISKDFIDIRKNCIAYEPRAP